MNEDNIKSGKVFGSLLVLAVGTFLLGMAEFVMEGILPDLSRDLNITIPQAGHVFPSMHSAYVSARLSL